MNQQLSLLGQVPAALRAQYVLRRAERMGPRVRVWGRLIAAVQGRLVLGDRIRLIAEPICSELAVGPRGVLEIGDGVFINYGASIAATQLVRIGENSIIGPHALLMDNDFHRLEPNRRNEMPASRPVVLQRNVWLGARVTVLPGVTIGEDSVIGAGSVVTHDIPAGVIAAGVPARVMKSLQSVSGRSAVTACPEEMAELDTFLQPSGTALHQS